MATGVNWGANYVVSATFLSISKVLSTHGSGDDSKPDGAFWMYGGITALGWVYFYFTMPETKGKTLEEIQALFEDGPRDRHSFLASPRPLTNTNPDPDTQPKPDLVLAFPECLHSEGPHRRRRK